MSEPEGEDPSPLEDRPADPGAASPKTPAGEEEIVPTILIPLNDLSNDLSTGRFLREQVAPVQPPAQEEIAPTIVEPLSALMSASAPAEEPVVPPTVMEPLPPIVEAPVQDAAAASEVVPPISAPAPEKVIPGTVMDARVPPEEEIVPTIVEPLSVLNPAIADVGEPPPDITEATGPVPEKVIPGTVMEASPLDAGSPAPEEEIVPTIVEPLSVLNPAVSEIPVGAGSAEPFPEEEENDRAFALESGTGSVPLNAGGEWRDEVFPDAASAEDLDGGTPADIEIPSEEQGEWRLSPEMVLAGRYRIVAPIARGAVGEVYEAEDLELGEKIALKTIRDEAAAEDTLGRFRREIFLARKVTHRNVCRIFDIVHDGGVTFVTMELLRGETLSDLIARKGRLDMSEASPIIQQLAAGLDAAHAAGVVHRDFKSGTVLLVPSARSSEEPRVVITDFGLARSVASDPNAPTVTGPGDLIGTPAYMSPEQVAGENVGPASDLFALGIVIFEMLTGRLPFAAEGSLASAVKRLTSPPASLRELAPEVDPAWENAILKCLERYPENRFASAAELWSALGSAVPPALPAVRRPPQAWRYAALAAIAIVLLGVMSILLRQRSKPAGAQGTEKAAAAPAAATRPLRPRPEARKSVAVVGFSNLSRKADTEWLSTAFAEMLGSEISASEKVRTIPGESVARMKSDLGLTRSEIFAKDTLAKIRSNLGVDYVVIGGYVSVGEGAERQLRLDLNIQDAASGELVGTITQVGAESELLDIVSRTGEALRARLGAGALSTEQAARAAAALPPSPGIARFYAEGLEYLRRFEAQKALDSLGLAAVADPDYPLVHSALSSAWSLLGYDAKAKDEARIAFQHSRSLTREDALVIEGQYREINGEWMKAIETYRALFDLFPDNEDYGLKLAYAQVQGGKAKDATATLQTLRSASPNWRDDPRTSLALAEAAFAGGDYAAVRDDASAAAAGADSRGDRLVAARARFFQGAAFWKLGDPDKAIASYTAAQKTFEESGNPGGVARALNAIGVVLDEQGNFEQARKMYSDSLAIIRRIGYKRSLAAALNNIANSYEQQGDLAQTRKMFEESLAISREIGDRAAVSTISNNLASVLVKEGSLPQAQTLFQESAAIARELNRRSGEAIVMDNLGMMLFRRGDIAGARQSCSQSLAIAKSIGYRRLEHIALYDLGEILLSAGDTAGARKSVEQSLAIRQQMRDQQGVTECRLALARIALAEGRVPDAAAMLQGATSASAKSGREQQAVLAMVRARIALASGDVKTAREALTQAQSAAGEMRNVLLRWPVEVTAARVTAGEGKIDAAVNRLAAIADEAAQKGFIDQQLEARLARCELLRSSGSPEAAAAARALEQDARTRGFLGIARRSAALMR